MKTLRLLSIPLATLFCLAITTTFAAEESDELMEITAEPVPVTISEDADMMLDEEVIEEFEDFYEEITNDDTDEHPNWPGWVGKVKITKFGNRAIMPAPDRDTISQKVQFSGKRGGRTMYLCPGGDGWCFTAGKAKTSSNQRPIIRPSNFSTAIPVMESKNGERDEAATRNQFSGTRGGRSMYLCPGGDGWCFKQKD